MFRAAIRSLLARKVRLLLTCLSVVLGVGFMAGTFVLTDTMTSAFDDLFDNGVLVDRRARAQRERLHRARPAASRNASRCPSRSSTSVRGVSGWRAAEGDVVGYAQIVDPATGKVIGTFGPPTAASAWNELDGFTLKPRRVTAERTRPGRDRRRDGRRGTTSRSATASRSCFEGPPGEFDVVGIVGYGDADSLAGATLGAVRPADRAAGARQGGRARLGLGRGGPGRLGVDLRARIAAGAAEGRRGRHGRDGDSEAQDQISTGLGFLRTALLVFAFVALFVGAFIIFNTFAIIVAQRTRELALFRALGASGRQVMTSVMIEATVIGVVVLAARRAGRHRDRDPAQGRPQRDRARDPSSGTVILGRTFVVSIVVGTLVTVIAALVPARARRRVAPIEALREAQDRPGRSLRFRLISGRGRAGARDRAARVRAVRHARERAPARRPGSRAHVRRRRDAHAADRPAARGRHRAADPQDRGARQARRRELDAEPAPDRVDGLRADDRARPRVFVAVFGASAKASTIAVLDRTLKADFILNTPQFDGFSTNVADDLRGIRSVETVSQVRQAEVHIKGGTRSSRVWTRRRSRSCPSSACTAARSATPGPEHDAVVRRHGRGQRVDRGRHDQGQVRRPGRWTSPWSRSYSENGLLGDYADLARHVRRRTSRQRARLLRVRQRRRRAPPGRPRTDVEKVLHDFPNVEVLNQAQFRDKYATFGEPAAEPGEGAAGVRDR